jgi:hypothetical protein
VRTLPAHTRRRLLDQAVSDVIVARQMLDGSLALIYDSLAGHPQAARYDGHTDQTPKLWCFTHERDHRRCEHDGLGCGGTPVTAVDPTGEAATSPDAAAAAQRTIDRAIVGLAVSAQTLAVELASWAPPSADMQRPDPTSVTAPDGWCTSCWRDNRTHEPVGVRPGGTAPYYAGLCEWCGRFRKAQGYLPPVELLRKRHSANPRISEADVARYRPPGR